MSKIFEITNDEQSVDFDETSIIQRTYNGIQSKDFGRLFMIHLTSDVLFELGDSMIPAHKSILAGRNDTFYDLFYKDGASQTIIKVTDSDFKITCDGFKTFLRFFYMNTIQINTDNVTELYLLARKFDEPQLEELCASFLENTLTFSTVFTAHDLAIKFKRPKLMLLCGEKFQSNANQLFLTEEFSCCSFSTFKKILSSMDRTLDPGIEVNICIKWAKNKCRQNKIDPDNLKNCRKQLGDCFGLLRFSTMSSEQFLACLRDYIEMFTKEEIIEIIHEIVEKNNQNVSGSSTTSNGSDFHGF